MYVAVGDPSAQNLDPGTLTMKIATCVAILAAVCFCSVGQVKADTITYSLTTTASGTFAGSSFTNAVVTVTLTGDTANVTAAPPPNTSVLVNPGSATVSVSGFGTGTLTDSIVIVNSFAGNPGVLFFDTTSQTGLVAQLGSAFTGYNLAGPFASLTGTGGVASGSAITPKFPTTAGELTWATGQSLGTSTFTAAVPQVPEPGTLTLLGSGLVGMAFRRRRAA